MNPIGIAAEVAETATGVVAKASSFIGWLPWIIAGVSLVSGAGGTLWYRDQFHQCQASVAIDAAKAEEQTRVATQRDNELIRQLSEQLAPIVSTLNRQNTDVQVALAKVKPNAACANTDAARAFDSIVRPGATGQAPNGGPAKAGR